MCERGVVRTGNKITLVISNYLVDVDGIIQIIKSKKKLRVLIVGVSETTKH